MAHGHVELSVEVVSFTSMQECECELLLSARFSYPFLDDVVKEIVVFLLKFLGFLLVFLKLEPSGRIMSKYEN